MTKIIDNSAVKLASILCEEFNDMQEIAIASAYFNIHGYGQLKKGLANKPLSFLLGREPTESIKWEEEILKELEEQEDNLDYFDLLKEAISFFEDSKREIRIPYGPFFHGKSYIAASPNIREIKYGVGAVGSSNFTYGGLVSNRELNMLNTDREVIQDLADWFIDRWDNSYDFKEDFLDYLRNYVTTHSPYDVIAKALYETYKSSLEAPQNITLRSLYHHQALSYRDASKKLEKYGGALIADSTGLGKSRTCISLALDAIKNEHKVLLIAPKSILDATWQTEMKKTGVLLDSISTEMLSSDPDRLERDHPDSNFFIIDEGHYFRNPTTKRYVAVRNHILKNDAKVVLATATPINNSLMDLYHQLALYLKENCIEDLFGQTLAGYFAASQKRWLSNQKLDMEDVLQRFVTRHSRELAKALDVEGKINFPERVLDQDSRNKYSIDIDLTRVEDLLDKMKYPYYDLSVDRLWDELRLPGGMLISKAAVFGRKESLKKMIKILIELNFFKRLESSVEAFEVTLQTLDTYIKNAVVFARKKGYFVPPAMKGDLLYITTEDEGDEDEELKITTPEEFFSGSKYASRMSSLKLTKDEARGFIASCRRDRALISQILKMIPPHDKKLELFLDRLRDVIKTVAPESNNGVLIFTQYTATARYIYERLIGENLKHRVLLTTGSTSRDADGKIRDKTNIIKNFQANGGILVSTNVLSAGQNLQNAQWIVNYDFPWNPVVIIQRIGRVDRQGSPHKEIHVINMIPKNGDREDPKSLEYFLGLMTKIYMRLEAIRETIGLDASNLGEQAEARDFGIQQAIARNDPTILAQLARDLEQFTTSAMDTLATMMNEKGLQWLQNIPRGIGSFKKGEKAALFILFEDGKKNHYWRIKDLTSSENSNSPTEIINIILDGETQNKGDKIQYELLIDNMKSMKNDLREEIISGIRRLKTLNGMVPRSTKTIKEIFDALANSGPDGERLAAEFRKAAVKTNLVKALNDARKSGKLVETARQLLVDTKDTIIEPILEEEITLKRVCWCWIQPNNTYTA